MKVVNPNFLNSNFNVEQIKNNEYFQKEFQRRTKETQPKLNKYIKLKKTLLTTFLITFLISLALLISFIVEVIKLTIHNSISFSLLIAFIICVLLSISLLTSSLIINNIYKTKNKTLGKELLNDPEFRMFVCDTVLRCLFPGRMKYEPKGGFKTNIIKDLNLFNGNNIDEFLQEDHIVSTNHQISFELADVSCKSKLKDGSLKSFVGVILTYDYFNKIHLDKEIIIKEPSFNYLDIPNKFEIQTPERMVNYYHLFDTYVEEGGDLSTLVSMKFLDNINEVVNSIEGCFMFYFSYDKLYIFIQGTQNDFLYDKRAETLEDLINICYEEFGCFEEIYKKLNLIRILPYNGFKANVNKK